MRGAVLYGPRDVRLVERVDPTIIEPTDAIIQLSASCVCGSDLWPYRGIEPINEPRLMGHEYCGIVEEVGSAVRNIKPGQFVVGSFFASDNTCAICQAGYQSRCVHNQPIGAEGAQATGGCVPSSAPRERGLLGAMRLPQQIEQVGNLKWFFDHRRRDALRDAPNVLCRAHHHHPRIRARCLIIVV